MVQWIEVDKDGLAKLIDEPSDAIRELVSNCLDTDAKTISVSISPIEGRRGVAEVVVEDDDPQGFKNLEHAWTMFAESNRKGDPTKRGRFCMGEKLVLALCEEASIETTTGSVRFDDKGRHVGRKKRESGSVFRAVMRLKREDITAARGIVKSIILEEDDDKEYEVTLTIDGDHVRPRKPVVAFGATLPTQFADTTGALRPTARLTSIRLYKPIGDEVPHLYELGVPVMKLDGGERWHVDVGQKVQLTMDRKSVTTTFVRELRVALLNNAFCLLEEEDARAQWTRTAISSPKAEVEAVKTIAKLRYGEGAVAADPSDREAEKRAASKDVVVVHGGSASADEWSSFKRAGVLQPAGKVYATPKPYSSDPAAPAATLIERKDWTLDQRRVVLYIEQITPKLIGSQVDVKLVRTTNGFAACYKRGELDLNVFRLGHAWFKRGCQDVSVINELLIHELGHHYSHDHLSERYHDALCSLGAKLTKLALEKPLMFVIGPKE